MNTLPNATLRDERPLDVLDRGVSVSVELSHGGVFPHLVVSNWPPFIKSFGLVSCPTYLLAAYQPRLIISRLSQFAIGDNNYL
jgi:hypothetical protein